MRSFTTRFTLLYAAVAALLLVSIGLMSTLSAMGIYAALLNVTVVPAGDRSKASMTSDLARGESFAAAAAKVVRGFDHPLMRVVIYDANHRPVAASAGSDGSANRMETALGILGGLRAAEEAVPGGSLTVSADTSHFGTALAAYWGRLIAIGSVAIGIAFVLGRAVTRRAMLPVASLTTALRSFADGDLAPHAIVAANDIEFGTLAQAYREAVIQTQRAFESHQRSQLQIQHFIADAGHELRTPLTVVTGYVDALRDGIVLDPARVRLVHDNLMSECRRMRIMIDKLIYLARLDEKRLPETNATPLDVANLARTIVEHFLPLAPRLRLSIADAAMRYEVSGDETELREALENIIDNAIKYAPGAPIDVIVERHGTRLLVTVVDGGPGMSDDDRARAFDRFYRGSARGETEGAGLGLAIAKRVVERMDGTIALTGERGNGTKVSLDLPCFASAAELRSVRALGRT